MARKVLVAGSGAIGLRTALELIHRNVSVVLQSPIHPLHPHTCSMGAGGLWMPFRCHDPRVDQWALETLDEILLRYHAQPDLVEIVPTVSLMREHGGPSVSDFATCKYEAARGGATRSDNLPAWTRDPRIQFQHLTVEMLSWQNHVHRLLIPPEQELKEAGYLHAWFFYPPIVNAPKMLQHLLAQVRMHAVEVNVETGHYFTSVDEMRQTAADLGCDAVINCTGLGAAAICGDEELTGARGILLQLDRATCVRRRSVRESAHGGFNTKDALVMIDDEPWGSESMPCYLIPRGDTIVVGGSYLKGDTETGIRQEERERLLWNATRLGIDLNETAVLGEWTGFRPYRPIVRCEMDDRYTDGVRVAHNYGHGGSGWTVNVGAAKECVDLLLGTSR